MTTDNDKTAALEAKLQAAQARIARAELTNGLVLAGANRETLDDALALLGSKARVAFAEDGEPVTIELDGEQYDSAADAAKAFLGSRKHFRAQEPQQQGQQQPTQEPPKPRPEALVSSAFAPRQAPQKPQQPTKLPAGNGADLLEQGYRPEDLVSEGLGDPAA